jgi:hypothetical protein
MRDSDLTEYLDNDLFPEYPLHGSGDPSSPAVPAQGCGDASTAERCTAGRVPEPSEPRQRSYPPEAGRAPPGHRPGERSATCERDQFESDVVRLVMEIFPGARRTTKDEYRRRAQQRDRKVRKKRA